MVSSNVLEQVILTDKAQCRDCYKCLRACPVKAIEMHDGQARVVMDRCVACGTCVRECPQGAKRYRNDIDRAARLLNDADTVCVSIAPSFATAFDTWARDRLPSALRQLGFAYVGETALGATDVAHATAQHAVAAPDSHHVCSACPAAVYFIEQYATDFADRLVPVVSPMIAHARRLKQRFGPDTRVVFVGPCIAKKAEAQRPELADAVDVVLTFDELQTWIDRSPVDLKHCEESTFDESPGPDARFFPVPGGLARTAQLETNQFDRRIRAASGFEEFDAALNQLRTSNRPTMLEPLFCEQGCVHGPGMPKPGNRFEQRDRLIEFAEGNPGNATHEPLGADALRASYAPRPVRNPDTQDEAAITEMLEQLGRANPEDRLNCGACGYESCRAKAVAVLEGMAEPEMCIPRMRQLAERRTDRIIDTSPNGIVILDRGLKILSMNPAFHKMFTTSDAVLGKPIDYLVDPEPFERLAAGETDRIQERRRYPNYSITCHQIVYTLAYEQQYVGIFVDTTASTRNERQLRQLREQTQAQARELLDHHVNMGQQIAKLLGESTARGEALVHNLLELTGDENGDDREAWRDIYTSK